MTAKQTTLTLAALLLACCSALGQSVPDKRRITPVQPSTNTVLRPAKGTSEEVVQSYLTGDTSAALAKVRKDSLSRIYPRYPRLTQLIVGVNVLDGALMAFGQDYGSLIDMSVTLNMWNRLQPVVELGIGRAKTSPDEGTYTYTGKLAPFARLGADYNLLFKKTPDYQGFLGFRVGASAFEYDVTASNRLGGYWQEQDQQLAMTGLKSHALWGELVAGLRVKVWKRLSMGWQVHYKGIFSYKKDGYSRPWYVPGYGSRDRAFSFSFSAYYVLPLSAAKWPQDPKPATAD